MNKDCNRDCYEEKKRTNLVYVFGAGENCRKLIRKFSERKDTEIIGLLDNNQALHGKKLYGYEIYRPGEILSENFDYIVLMVSSYGEIKKQLLDLGIDKSKIKPYEEYIGNLEKGKYVYYSDKHVKNEKGGILLVGSYIDYSGGVIAGVYALRAMKERGYNAAFLASDGNETFIEELSQEGISVYIYANLSYENISWMDWLSEYQCIIVNTYLMHGFLANNIELNKKMIWWLHESDNIYIQEIGNCGLLSDEVLKKADIYCVSELAKSNFAKHYPDTNTHIMEYGIPDESGSQTKSIHKLTFALIGATCSGKGHDIFLEAIELLDNEDYEECRFIFVGDDRKNDYAMRLRERIDKLENVEYFESMPHNELMKLFANIDVVVSASRADSLPIVVTEGMMLEKACIISDVIGTVRYIKAGADALIFESENCNELKEQMHVLIHDPDLRVRLGKEARQLYKKVFGLESLWNRLKCAFDLQSG